MKTISMLSTMTTGSSHLCGITYIQYQLYTVVSFAILGHLTIGELSDYTTHKKYPHIPAQVIRYVCMYKRYSSQFAPRKIALETSFLSSSWYILTFITLAIENWRAHNLLLLRNIPATTVFLTDQLRSIWL